MKANDLFPGCTGTEFYHQHLPGFHFTDGVMALSDECESYWFLDFIFSNQLRKKFQAEQFQKWVLKKVGEGKFRIHATDGNTNILLMQAVQSDFQYDECEIWLENKVMMLPSEH